MPYLNTNQTLTKCHTCGQFVSEASAYYGKVDPTVYDSPVFPFCSQWCCDQYHGRNFCGFVDDDGSFIQVPV